MKDTGSVWQTGMWQRSAPNFRRGVELVRNGMLGKILKVEVGTGPNKQVMPPAPQPGEKAPAEVDYDLWVGPSADFAYDPRVFHFHWRWNMNFGGGMLLDWVCHHPDIAAWAMGKDAEFPVSVEGTGKLREGPWDTPVPSSGRLQTFGCSSLPVAAQVLLPVLAAGGRRVCGPTTGSRLPCAKLAPRRLWLERRRGAWMIDVMCQRPHTSECI